MWFLPSTRGLKLLAAIVLAISSSSLLASTAGQLKPVRRVLILHQIGLSSPSVFRVDQEIRAALDNSPFQVEIVREFLETTLFPEPKTQKDIRDWYVRKYRNRVPDLVITDGPDPLRFVAASHEKLFPDTPVVFGGLSGVQPLNLNLDSNFTGVWDTVEPAKILEMALRLEPSTKHVVVVGGTDAFDLELESWFHESLRAYESKLDFTYLTDLAMQQLLDRLEHLESNTIILLTHVGRDADGTPFIGASQADPMIVRAANAPVFSPSDVDMGHGEVGGYLDSFSLQGKLMGEMAVRILNGEKPKDIPIARGADVYMFDWRALKRWHMNEKYLPAGSIVLNREPTAWESYRWYIGGGMFLILLEAFLISGLLWQRGRRRQASRALRAREELLRVFVKNVPAAVAMLDRHMHYLQVSDRWCTDYLHERTQVLGRSHYELFPDMPERWKEIHRRSLQGETLRSDEDRWEGQDGSHWARWEVRPWKTSEGTVGGILILTEDITHRKKMEESLSSMSRKLIETQEQERSRIARELHDDINQQLALLAVELDQLDRSGFPKQVYGLIQGFKQRIMGIATAVQAISHQLHSSKLEYLGLAAAAKSYCREMSEMHHVRIDFTHNGVPRNLPAEVALCLFRVLQEALQNAVKYSGIDHFEVGLSGTATDIWLRVRDFGRGFDVEDGIKSGGLGLVSMRERVNLVNGEIVINSKPTAGTEIAVHVPVRMADRGAEVTSGAA